MASLSSKNYSPRATNKKPAPHFAPFGVKVSNSVLRQLDVYNFCTNIQIISSESQRAFPVLPGDSQGPGRDFVHSRAQEKGGKDK